MIIWTQKGVKEIIDDYYKQIANSFVNICPMVFIH